MLALAGGALGVVLAQAGLKVLLATAPDTLPRLAEISLDPRVVAFAVVISFASSLLFAAIPAFTHKSPIGSAAIRRFRLFAIQYSEGSCRSMSPTRVAREVSKPRRP